MGIKFNFLSVEVTRKCNLKCAHCLRGKAESGEIKFENIDSLLSQTSYIYHLTFTGGEPSLNVPAIEYFYYKARINGVKINHFAIPTNGIKITPEFVDVCDKLNSIVENKSYKGVVISNDKYHMSQRKYDDTLFQGKPYFRLWFDDWYDWDNGKRVQREGYGVTIKEARNTSMAKRIWNSDDFSNNAHIYLNVKGEIINGLDWSYANQPKHFLCNVKNLTEYYESISRNKIKVI